MVIFGFLYYALSFFSLHAIYDKNKPIPSGITGLATAEYFSFITAASASQGYGEIFPLGI